jgi:hypothetical protein
MSQDPEKNLFGVWGVGRGGAADVWSRHKQGFRHHTGAPHHKAWSFRVDFLSLEMVWDGLGGGEVAKCGVPECGREEYEGRWWGGGDSENLLRFGIYGLWVG